MKKQTGKLVFLALTLVLTACGTGATTPKPTTQTTGDTQCGQDDAYYDGIVVIAQYYTLFEHGLYEDAYQLLSSSRPHANSLEEFVTNSEMLKIKEMRIVTIRPYCESISQLQTWTTPDPTNRKMFYAQVYVEGESGMAGAVENGVHTYFITIVLENGEWKIYSINTAPLP
jgi:hypothetical protein